MLHLKKINRARSLAKIISFVLLLLSCSCMYCTAQLGITVTGSWSTVLPVASVTEAGNDFQATYTSAANQVLLNFFKIQGNSPFNYRIDIRKSDIDWNASLKLYARRSGDGNPLTGNTGISGGTTFQLLTNTNQLFFSGYRGRDNVPVQFQLTGVSVLIPAKTHTTTVIYTITEL